MVNSLDIGAETTGKKPADERHQCLEEPKEKGQTEHDAGLGAPDDNSADDRYCKAVHGQCKCD